jgi:hypothetical protein
MTPSVHDALSSRCRFSKARPFRSGLGIVLGSFVPPSPLVWWAPCIQALLRRYDRTSRFVWCLHTHTLTLKLLLLQYPVESFAPRLNDRQLLGKQPLPQLELQKLGRLHGPVRYLPRQFRGVRWSCSPPERRELAATAGWRSQEETASVGHPAPHSQACSVRDLPGPRCQVALPGSWRPRIEIAIRDRPLAARCLPFAAPGQLLGPEMLKCPPNRWSGRRLGCHVENLAGWDPPQEERAPPDVAWHASPVHGGR